MIDAYSHMGPLHVTDADNCVRCGLHRTHFDVPCSGKKPAGNSFRHELAVENSLWDRLRADLANLGAAYGELPAHIRDYQEGPRETVPDHSGDVTNMITEPDRNLYYDGIILAARKKREAAYDRKAWLSGPLMSKETVKDLLERIEGDIVSIAMDRPLDHEPRLGWKPGDCE